MRLIDADALLSELGECPYNWTDTEWEVQEVNDWEMFRNMIDNAPTVQAKGDPISRQDARKAIFDLGGVSTSISESAYNRGIRDALNIIKELPSVEQKQGKWINREKCQVDEDAYEIAICSECGAEITLEYSYDSFCPNCGAKMGVIQHDANRSYLNGLRHGHRHSAHSAGNTRRYVLGGHDKEG